MKSFAREIHNSILTERNLFIDKHLNFAIENKSHTAFYLIMRLEDDINRKLKNTLCDRIFNGITYDRYIFYYQEK